MKFEYDGKEDRKDMVAFVDSVGDLCIKIGDGIAYLLNGNDGFAHDEADFSEYASNNGVTKAFYPGDKITITF